MLMTINSKCKNKNIYLLKIKQNSEIQYNTKVHYYYKRYGITMQGTVL
jgi:hypothetical protein